MDTPHDPPRSNALCPSCGAPLPPEASSCAVCGRPTALTPSPSATASPAEPPAEAPAQPAPVPVPVQAAAETVQASATENATPSSFRVCDWCGAANPVTAGRCEKCGASFPRPEQDDLLTRASAERVRLALNEIEMHERLRTPWWRRLLGGNPT